MKISLSSSGNFNETEKWLRKASTTNPHQVLAKYGREGVAALKSATPADSGKTASSWSYEIISNGVSAELRFNNSNINKNVNIAVILQYGHGTGTGGYVQGRDYINPAIQPVFDKIAEEALKEVTS